MDLAIRRHVCPSPDPVYTGPFVAMVADTAFFGSFSFQHIIQHLFQIRKRRCDVVEGGMSSILGTARTLLQEYAVKGALLCTAGTSFFTLDRFRALLRS